MFSASSVARFLKLRRALPALLAPLCLAGAQTGVTRITVSDHVLRHDVKRFGINLGGQNFYDSGQMLRNVVSRNPGFEGGMWQTILRCKTLTRTSCKTDAPTAWPSGFLDGATFEIATGAAAGTHGDVRASAATAGGYTVTFATPLVQRVTDSRFLIVRKDRPGNPTAGWWTNLTCGSTATAERQDLPPNSPSRQAVRVDALSPCKRAVLTSYFDSTKGYSFVRFHGDQLLRFKAKPIAGNAGIRALLQRDGTPAFLDREVILRTGWQNYTVPFRATEKEGSTGVVGLSLTIEGSTVLLDDVSLTPAARTTANATAFRDEVVSTLRDLRPGMLRLMDSGTSFGTSLDNWLRPQSGRARAGYSIGETEQEDLGIGLEEFLELAEAVGAEPWVSMPAGMSSQEAQNLIQYLSGAPSTPYGSLRAKQGHPKPWDESLQKIHLEPGNEMWNRGSFAGATLDDAGAEGERAAYLFHAMRHAPDFHPAHFDLVIGTWAEMPKYTAGELETLHGEEDTIAIAPYLFSHYENAPGMEGVYGPMLAQPEQMTRAAGTVSQQATLLHTAGRRLAVYEVNLGTLNGAATITQAAIDRTVPTIGAALAVADHMLLMLRDTGITDQCFFALSEFRNGFTSAEGAASARTTPLYGAVLDMGGSTNGRRPSFLALRMLNQAMLANLFETVADGRDPTWDQAPSTNDGIALQHAHLLQSFAFGDGNRRSLIELNLSRTQSLPVTFAGTNAPRGSVVQTVLTSAHIEDSNEHAPAVAPQTSVLAHFDPAVTHWLPPFSLTTYTWKVP